MKFFHLSDLHIGKHLFYYSLLEDQKYVFHQILEAAKEEQPDAVLLCGDIMCNGRALRSRPADKDLVVLAVPYIFFGG